MQQGQERGCERRGWAVIGRSATSARPDLTFLRAAVVLLTAGLILAQHARAADAVLVPRIEGQWWRISGNPDLGRFTTDRQQPVDFAIWQAADGTATAANNSGQTSNK